jgi:hypothetical protein
MYGKPVALVNVASSSTGAADAYAWPATVLG